MAGWRHRLDGHEFEQMGEGQGGPGCKSMGSQSQTRLSDSTTVTKDSEKCGSKAEHCYRREDRSPENRSVPHVMNGWRNPQI